jgi:hypothetical protein
MESDMTKGPFVFTVLGSGTFPFDMLRYDGCWPYESEDAAKIEASHREPGQSGLRAIVLQTNNPHAPTYRRWESFTWRAYPGLERQISALLPNHPAARQQNPKVAG